MVQVIQVIESMTKGGPIIHVNIRLGKKAGGTCIKSITSDMRDTSNMSKDAGIV